MEITDRDIIAAAKNDWDKEFTLGKGDEARTFNIKDLSYYDYIDFITLVKPVIELAVNSLETDGKDGTYDIQFNPAGLDFDKIIGMCGKDLPKMAWLVCKQSDPRIKPDEVAMLAHRPQRLVEIVLMQILHNNMIQEFAGFFQRLTAMVTVMMPDLAKAAAPSAPETEPMTEETLSSS